MTTHLVLLHLSQWLLFNLLGVGAFGVLEGDIPKMDDDPRWVEFGAERDKLMAALDTAITAAAAIAANHDSPLSALYKQRYAEALPKLVWLRAEVFR